MPVTRISSPARYVRALQKRVDYLARLAGQGRANGFDQSERRALNWAIGEICRVHNLPRPIGQKESE